MGLTPQQLGFFDTFGYLKFPGLFSKEIHTITSAFEQVWSKHGGGHHGKEHDRKQRSALVPFIDQDEYLCTLLDEPRIERAIASILGDDFNYHGSDGNFYVGDTRWHSDGYDKHPHYTSIKIAFYLDPVTRNTGCLRVIPGSHKLHDGFSEALQKVTYSSETTIKESWGIPGNEVPSVALESIPGDVVMFNHRIKHSSWGGSDRRRMFTMNFQERFAKEHIEELREDIAGGARFWLDEPYGKIMVKTASKARMIRLEQHLANSDHLPSLATKARREMSEPSRS